jgi:hypothetical protein
MTEAPLRLVTATEFDDNVECSCGAHEPPPPRPQQRRRVREPMRHRILGKL